jgi:uncharacterized protein (TIGR03437 family)
LTVGARPEVVEARFRRLVRVAGVVAAGAGAGARIEAEPDSADGYHLEGTRVRLKAVAGEGESFLGWRLPRADTDTFPATAVGRASSPLEWTAETAGVEFTADFSAKPLTTIASDAPDLMVSVDGTSMATPVKFAFEAGTEHAVRGWYGSNYSGTSYYDALRWRTPEGLVDDWRLAWKAGEGPAELTAECARWHMVQPAVDYYLPSGTAPDGGDLQFSPASPDYYFEEGTELEVTPPTHAAWNFVNWYGEAHGREIPYRFRVTGPRVLVANFLTFGTLNSGAIVNDASRQPGVVSPGERLRIHWNGGNPSAPVAAPDGAPLPQVLGGVEVRFDQQRAGLVSVSKDEVVCVVPDTVKGKTTVAIAVVNGRLGTISVDTAVLSRSPGIYTADGSGWGVAVERAVREGEPVELAVTGLDVVEETLVRVGGQVTVAEAVEKDEARPGIYKVRFVIPAGVRAGAAELFVQSGGKASQPGVHVVVE